MKNPKVSVVMPVYNGETYLKEAIESILNQSFSDFEFIIINDGSSDKSAEIIRSFADSSISFINLEVNQGLVNALNLGLKEAKGEYVAIMHSDDIALPDRLLKQVAFLDANPSYGLCGSFIELMRSHNRKFYYTIYLSEDIDNKIFLLFNNPICHPTVMMRVTVIASNSLLYKKEYFPAEDFKMWTRIANFAHIGNIPEILLRYRVHESQVSNNYNLVEKIEKVVREQLLQLELSPTQDEMKLHITLSTEGIRKSVKYLSDLKMWVAKLKQANAKKQVYEVHKFNMFLDRMVDKKKKDFKGYVKGLPVKQKAIYYIKNLELIHLLL